VTRWGRYDDNGALTHPARIPAAPIPATALPIMNAIELGAAPQMAEPTSKSNMLRSRTIFTLYIEYIFPNMSWKEPHVIRYALAYQPISGRDLNSLVMSGIA